MQPLLTPSGRSLHAVTIPWTFIATEVPWTFVAAAILWTFTAAGIPFTFTARSDSLDIHSNRKIKS